MKSKLLLIAGVLAIIAIAGIGGFMIVSITPSSGEEDVPLEEINGLLDDLETLDDIESELNLEEEDLDIAFD
jgi:hypothetical protein